MSQFAPIALIVYARPEHTRRTLESLRNNTLADQSELYVFADGPKADASEETQENIAEVRRIVREIGWPSPIHFDEQETNRGLDNSIIHAVTMLTEKYGRVIVVEDDLVLGKGFLEFINKGLDLYEDSANVFGVTGYISPTKRQMPPSYFLPVFSSWGWGTWKRAWDTFTHDPEGLYESIMRLPEPVQERFDFGKMPNREMLHNIITQGKTTCWDVCTNATMFLKDMLFLYPGQSLVQNTGYDGTGSNCIPQETFYSSVRATDFQPIEKIAPQLEKKWVDAVAKARRANHKPTLQTRAIRRIKR
ncbi:MAG: glycosyltransferase family A protein, partial [Bacteroidota bacterium]